MTTLIQRKSGEVPIIRLKVKPSVHEVRAVTTKLKWKREGT